MPEKTALKIVHRMFLGASVGVAVSLACYGRWEGFNYFLIGWFMAVLLCASHDALKEKEKPHA